MIKRSIFFILGFATAIALLFWPRSTDEPEETELFNATFRFVIKRTTELDIVLLQDLGYHTYGDWFLLDDAQASQWNYYIEGVPMSDIKKHFNDLIELNYQPEIAITSVRDGSTTRWT